jgi:HEAT repeat protein
LSLQSFDDVAADIAIALKSEDPWMRYWGLIVLSSFKDKAQTFIEIARRMATEDVENLVRLRAAEFLGLVQAENPAPYLIDALRTAKNEMEAVIILNTIVLLQDFHGYQIEVSSDILPSEWQSNGQSNLTLRLDHLDN